MENFAINSLLPTNTDASQTMGADENVGDGETFMDALSGLMKNAHGKEDKQQTTETVEPANEASNETSGQVDPAAGIAVMVSSLEQIATSESVTETISQAMAGMVSTRTTGARVDMDAGESASSDTLLAGSTDMAMTQVMNSRLVVAAQSTSATQTEAAAQSVLSASDNLADKGEKSRANSGELALPEGRLQNVPGLDESWSDKKISLQNLADSRQATQDRMTKPQSALQELRASDRQTAREPGSQNLAAQNMSPLGMASQFQAAFQLGAAQSASADNVLASQIAPRVGASGWSEAMGQRIVMMASEHVQQAEIRLNPEGLGPMQVVLSLEKGAADVQFLAHDAQVREALQSALPKLQEMLTSAGFSLDKVSIDSGSARNQNSQGNTGQFQQQRRETGQDNEGPASMPASRIVVQTLPGRIDTFA